MNKLRKIMINGAAAVGLACSISTANAGVLTLDGGWTEFSFEGVGSSWSESFTFSILGDAWLAVTDAFLSGDRFEFFVNGVSVGLTSMPTTEGDQISSNFDTAFADPRWSSAELMLMAGNYEITGSTILSPFGSGGAAIRLSSNSLGGPGFEPPVSTVPLPATGALLLIGLLGLGVFRRKSAA